MSLPATQAPLHFYPLRYLDEGEHVVVGRVDVDSYGVFPPDGVAMLRRLEDGHRPGEVATWYADTYGEPVDIDEFIDTLRDLSFVRREPDDGTSVPTAPAVRWQRLGTALFSPVAWLVYAALVLGAAAVCAVDPGYLPHREHVMFTDYLVLVDLTLLLGTLPITVLHEVFHYLAGRRLGLRASIGLGRRLYLVVAETRLDGLVVVPRRKRYLPILAGMLADAVVVAILTLIAWLSARPDGSLPLGGRICLAFAFTTLIGIGAQFFLFLRTDIYHLVTTVLGCVDLHATAQGMVRNRFWQILGRPDRMTSPERWHPRDRAVARWYTPLYLAGYGFMLAMLAVVVLPLAVQFVGTAIRTVADDTASMARSWDAAVFLVLVFGQLALSTFLAAREWRARTRTAEKIRTTS